MNNNFVSMTLPAKPQNKTSLGMLIAPVMMELLGNKINSSKIITLNNLHTYRQEDFKDVYFNDLKQNRISYDRFYIDSENTVFLLNVLEELIKNKKIVEKTKKIYHCECGMVDFVSEGICYNNGKLYKRINGSIICNHCNKEVQTKEDKVLVLPFKKEMLNIDKIKVVPQFLTKELQYFIDTFDGQDILISKQRDTGYCIKYNNTSYNIDIEFIWSQLFAMENNNKILYASNHQVYVMFIISLLNASYKNKDLIFVLSPYINNKTKFDNFDNIIENCRPLVKKLFLIFSLNWKKKDNSWNYGLYKNINKLDDENLNKLYNYISSYVKYSTSEELYDKIQLFLEKEICFEKVMKEIK